VTPDRLLADMWAQGIAVRLTADRRNLAVPAGRLNEHQRAMLVAHKAALTAFLLAAHETTSALLDAAMKACDAYGDNDVARKQMRADCLATPLHLRADLLQHFDCTLPEHPRKSQPPTG
jgi:hypothetical protein